MELCLWNNYSSFFYSRVVALFIPMHSRRLFNLFFVLTTFTSPVAFLLRCQNPVQKLSESTPNSQPNTANLPQPPPYWCTQLFSLTVFLISKLEYPSPTQTPGTRLIQKLQYPSFIGTPHDLFIQSSQNPNPTEIPNTLLIQQLIIFHSSSNAQNSAPSTLQHFYT